jgi:16S rRNA (adenine1518-N6/adenine1519-N6)-dimethyltransferase
VNSLTWKGYNNILEIGPGKGILTEIILNIPGREMKFVEIDRSSVEYLKHLFPHIYGKIITADILRIPLDEMFHGPFAIIGNFPYNISSQLFFRILDSRNLVIETICMIQKEVAVRIASQPGSKDYGILSVLLQAYYTIEYLFSVPPQVFTPPPRVNSAVIRLRRNNTPHLGCDDVLFTKVVKTAFNQRRKTLRNSLKNLITDWTARDDLWQKRPEQLGIQDFIAITRLIENKIINNHNHAI